MTWGLGKRGEGAAEERGGGGVGSGEGPQSPGSQILSSSQSGMAVTASSRLSLPCAVGLWVPQAK